MIKKLMVFCVMAAMLWTACGHADGRVYYEIFPASFYDDNGDGMGDLAGITRKVEYLKDLGVGGLWLMPVHPSPSYHKYDVLNYYAIDPAYGTMEDFETLVQTLRRNDMVLLMDLVLNHTSGGHEWFVSAIKSLAQEPCGREVCTGQTPCRAHNPYCAYYNFTTDAGLGWHEVPGAPGWYYEGGFSRDMPDLNLENPAVLREIEQIAAFWLGKGVGGFRLDAAAHYIGQSVEKNTAFLAWFMQTVHAISPDAYVVGEVWMDGGTIAQYYGSGISSLFNFPFSAADGAIVGALRSKKGAGFAQKAQAWQEALANTPAAVDSPFLSNHDQARVGGSLLQKPAKLKMAASMYLLLPGTPFMYYGEEIGMTGSGRDENKRLPMVWAEEDDTGLCRPPAGADQRAKWLADVAQSRADEHSLLNHYRALLHLRAQYPALQRGRLTAVDTGEAALCAYRLAHEGTTLLVLHNLGDEPVQVDIGPAQLVADLGEEGVQVQGSRLILPGLSSAVLVEQ